MRRGAGWWQGDRVRDMMGRINLWVRTCRHPEAESLRKRGLVVWMEATGRLSGE